MKPLQRTGWLFLVTSGCLLLGCEKHHHMIVEAQPLGDPFQISAAGYSTDYFFVDTSYTSLYELYFLNEPPQVDPLRHIVEIEVWKSRLEQFPDPNEIPGMAYSQIPAYNGGYPKSLRTGIVNPGNIEGGPVVRLNSDQYELLGDGYLGILRLRTPINDFSILAVAYRRADMVQFGEFAHDVLDSAFAASRTPILLKLVKPRNLLSVGPLYSNAWKLLVKSIYPTGYSGVIKTGFHLDVFDQSDASHGNRLILGQPLLAVLGLDRFSPEGAPGGDGVFDYRPGRTIDQLHGEIILPYLQPFDEGIRRYFASIGQPIPVTSDVLLPQLYSTTKADLARRLASRYVFKGSTLHQ